MTVRTDTGEHSLDGIDRLVTELIVDLSSVRERLDTFVARGIPDLSRNRAHAMIEVGAVRVDGKTATAAFRLRLGQVVMVDRTHDDDVGPTMDGAALIAEPIPIEVIHEEADFVVVNKSAGMVVHPGPGHPRGTLVNALLARYPDMRAGGVTRPGIVHRLDRDTSGLLVVARNEVTLAYLQRQFHDRTVEKRYLALVDGSPRTTAGVIDAPIGRRPDRPEEMGIVRANDGGRNAITRFHTVERFDLHTLLECRLVTGRTHQIRVHLASIGIPVVGDQVYGRAIPSLPLARQFLHAAVLAFTRTDGTTARFEAPPPSDLADCLLTVPRTLPRTI